MGVRSLIDFTSIPTVASARTADSRPAPGPLTRTSTERSPYSFALLAAVSEACCAAKGVPLRDPRNPSEPELDHAKTLPTRSVNVTIVLLNEAWTCTRPFDTTFFSFFLKVFFLVVFAGALAMSFLRSCPLPSFYWPPYRGEVPSACGRWCGCAVHVPAGRADAASPDRNPFR